VSTGGACHHVKFEMPPCEISPNTQKYVLGLRIVYACGLWKAGLLWCIVEVMGDAYLLGIFSISETFFLFIRMYIKDFLVRSRLG
jgi:hypothetical protein